MSAHKFVCGHWVTLISLLVAVLFWMEHMGLILLGDPLHRINVDIIGLQPEIVLLDFPELLVAYSLAFLKCWH